MEKQYLFRVTNGWKKLLYKFCFPDYIRYHVGQQQKKSSKWLWNLKRQSWDLRAFEFEQASSLQWLLTSTNLLNLSRQVQSKSDVKV
jgi:hypothetical protein